MGPVECRSSNDERNPKSECRTQSVEVSHSRESGNPLRSDSASSRTSSQERRPNLMSAYSTGRFMRRSSSCQRGSE